MRVLHVAPVKLDQGSGMGRVAFHWRNAFVARGHEFIHLGPLEIGPVKHPALFPLAAFRSARAFKPQPDVVLVHEPASALFALVEPGRTAVFSHGIERRAWELETLEGVEMEAASRPRTRILFPIWRLAPSDIGLARARLAFVLNAQDLSFVRRVYGRSANDTFAVANGVTATSEVRSYRSNDDEGPARILFLGSWLARKGVATLVEAAVELHRRGVVVKWTLAGTGVSEAEVRRHWPEELQEAIVVIPSFRPSEESALLGAADVFVLPSLFEGQPLALLQAMAAGVCCVVSRIGPHTDLVDDEGDGMLHEPGNAESLGLALARCARDSRLRERLGRAAQDRVRSRTWESCSDEVVKIVEAHFPPHR